MQGELGAERHSGAERDRALCSAGERQRLAEIAGDHLLNHNNGVFYT